MNVLREDEECGIYWCVMSDFDQYNDCQPFSRRFGIPAVIGQLLVGILLGNAGLKVVHPDILVEDFSEIGVILLMFLAGIESDLSLLRKYFRPGMYVAVLGILFPVVLGTVGGNIFHIAMNQSFSLD